MVATEKEEVLGILDLVGEEETDGLQALLASVDVVAEKEVVGLGREEPVLKQTKEVSVLPVNVAWRGRGEVNLSLSLSLTCTHTHTHTHTGTCCSYAHSDRPPTVDT